MLWFDITERALRSSEQKIYNSAILNTSNICAVEKSLISPKLLSRPTSSSHFSKIDKKSSIVHFDQKSI